MRNARFEAWFARRNAIDADAVRAMWNGATYVSSQWQVELAWAAWLAAQGFGEPLKIGRRVTRLDDPEFVRSQQGAFDRRRIAELEAENARLRWAAGSDADERSARRNTEIGRMGGGG